MSGFYSPRHNGLGFMQKPGTEFIGRWKIGDTKACWGVGYWGPNGDPIAGDWADGLIDSGDLLCYQNLPEWEGQMCEVYT